MLARCPHCDVAHATPRAPRSGPGAVRCGACGRAFEFFPALEIAPAGERVSGPGLTPIEATTAAPRPADETQEPRAPALPATGPAPLAPEHIEPSISAPADPAPVIKAPAAEPAPEPASAVAPAASPGASGPRGRSRAPALLLATALLGGLLFQVLAFPPPAVTAEPALETLRGDLCRKLHCPQRPLRAPDSVRVSTPSMHGPGAGSGRWLILDLYNGEPRAQAWPLLDISLSDTRGRTHARDRIHPRSYAPEDAPLMAAYQPATIALRIRTDHPRLTGVSVRPR